MSNALKRSIAILAAFAVPAVLFVGMTANTASNSASSDPSRNTSVQSLQRATRTYSEFRPTVVPYVAPVPRVQDERVVPVTEVKVLPRVKKNHRVVPVRNVTRHPLVKTPSKRTVHVVYVEKTPRVKQHRVIHTTPVKRHPLVKTPTKRVAKPVLVKRYDRFPPVIIRNKPTVVPVKRHCRYGCEAKTITPVVATPRPIEKPVVPATDPTPAPVPAPEPTPEADATK